MALVAESDQGYDTRSLASHASHIKAQHATEQARRRLVVTMETKDRQCEQLRSQVERKRKQLVEEKKTVASLYEAKEQEEATIQSLREEKLLWRVFKELDTERKSTLSLDNICSGISATEEERAFIDDKLFTQLPNTLSVTLRCREFSEADLIAIITEEMGVTDTAVELEVLDDTVHGMVRLMMRLSWHSHPGDIAEDPALDDEENERRRQQVVEYYEALGGSGTSVEPDVGRAKEAELVEVLQGPVPERTGWTVTRLVEEHRANFSDFISNFWFVVPEEEMPQSLLAKRQRAKIVEDETILPEEVLDRTTELEHTIKHQQKLKTEVLRDTQLCDKDIQAIDKQIDAVSRELAHIQRVTGFDAGNSKREHVDWHLQEEEIKQLTGLVKKLEEEHKMGQQILKKKTQLVEVLTQEVEDKSEVQEALFQAMNDLQVVSREVEQLTEETRKLMQDHNKSDRAIAVLDQRRDLVAVQCLQADKQFLQREISNHVSAKAESDRVIKAQTFRVGVLENRLSCVTAALKDLKSDGRIQRKLREGLTPVEDDINDAMSIDQIIPPMELVDVELYELLARDLEAINTSIKLKDIILLEKEATIEATEMKLHDLQREKEEDEDYYYFNSQKDSKDLEALKQEHQARQHTQRRERERLKRSVVTARQNAARMLRREA